MPSFRSYLGLGIVAALAAGCSVVPSSDLNDLKSQNASLSENNRVQTARIDNLQVHCRTIEDQLIDAERQLALLDEQRDLDRTRLTNYQFEHNRLQSQFDGMSGRPSMLSGQVSRQIAAISSRYPSLHFDPHTGISKLDTDILFDVGTAKLKPGADAVLAEMARVMKTPEASDLRIMVVGHTDDRLLTKKPARDQYRSNFDLSADRALVVCDALRTAGLPESRLGVAGFGSHQPIAPNITPTDRQKNRRVELFVLAPEVPVIGWTETIPSVY